MTNKYDIQRLLIENKKLQKALDNANKLNSKIISIIERVSSTDELIGDCITFKLRLNNDGYLEELDGR